MKNRKNLISALILLIGIPVIMAVGFLIFGGKRYAFISAGIAVLSCVPFFMSFERNSDNNSVKLVIISVMTALSVAGRVLFSMLYGIKPVNAIIIIAEPILCKTQMRRKEVANANKSCHIHLRRLHFEGCAHADGHDALPDDRRHRAGIDRPRSRLGARQPLALRLHDHQRRDAFEPSS